MISVSHGHLDKNFLYFFIKEIFAKSCQFLQRTEFIVYNISINHITKIIKLFCSCNDGDYNKAISSTIKSSKFEKCLLQQVVINM
jgi:hypothetical protein